MRLLLINYEFPPLGSGASNATLHLADEFSRRGHNVSVLTSLFRGLPRRERNGYRVERIPVLRRSLDRCGPRELLSFALMSAPAALAMARRSRPDCVLAFFGFPCGPAAWAVKKALGVPYVLSLRNADVPRRALSESRLLQHPMKALVRRLWRAADGIASVSAGLRDEALKIEPGLTIRVIPNGVDTALFHPGESRAEMGESLRILFVGRLRSFKGLQDLLPAIVEVRRESGRPIRLDIVGDGPYRPDLERQIATLKLGKVTHLLGRLLREKMPELYRAADMFVLPSHAEGMPNAVLEALASGLPVIATDVAGSRELVRTGIEGIIVPPHDSKALARAIVTVAASPEQYGRAARERAMSFSWGRPAEDYLDMMAEVAGRRG